MKYVFIIIHLLLGGVFFKTGIDSYWQGDSGWDAGVVPVFMAFWFFFSGFGFYRTNLWLVSMSGIALCGLLGLTFLVDFLEYFQTGSTSSSFAHPLTANLAVVGFLIAGEIYAIWRFRRPVGGPR